MPVSGSNLFFVLFFCQLGRVNLIHLQREAEENQHTHVYGCRTSRLDCHGLGLVVLSTPSLFTEANQHLKSVDQCRSGVGGLNLPWVMSAIR